jgi:hypothetical protein
MELNLAHHTLNWLLEKYLHDPNQLFDISDSLGTERDGFTTGRSHELGNFLVQKGFVKNHRAHENGFLCSITTLGMSQVSNMFTHIKYQILEGAIEQKKRSLKEILGIESAHFRKAKDFGTYLKRLGFIECIFHQDDVYAEPTFAGREWYHENKLKFAGLFS